MWVRRNMRLVFSLGTVALMLGCTPTQKKPPPPAPPVIAPAYVPPPPVEVPCEVTDTCPVIAKPPAPFNVMGAIIGDACPKTDDMLAPFASCRNGEISGITVIIPTLDEAAKNKVFARALSKYGTPFEDRTGGVPMQAKVTMPDWAATKTPPQLAETRGKRYVFWWIDEVAKHYLAVSELDEAVKIALRRLDVEAREKADRLKVEADKLTAEGARLTEAF